MARGDQALNIAIQDCLVDWLIVKCTPDENSAGPARQRTESRECHVDATKHVRGGNAMPVKEVVDSEKVQVGLVRYEEYNALACRELAHEFELL